MCDFDSSVYTKIKGEEINLNGMNLVTLVVGAVTISTLHALLPSHWLAFVLVGSAQGWPGSKIMKIALLAGSGHVAMATMLGLATATVAREIVSYLGYLEAYVTSGILIILGLVYVFLGIAHKKGHNHSFKGGPSDKATVTSLSPCEAMIPVFFAASGFGWSILLMLSLFVALGTISSMLALTHLTFAGYKRIRFTWLERNERATIGIILLALGVFTILLG